MKWFHPIIAITAALMFVSCGSSEDDTSSQNPQNTSQTPADTAGQPSDTGQPSDNPVQPPSDTPEQPPSDNPDQPPSDNPEPPSDNPEPPSDNPEPPSDNPEPPSDNPEPPSDNPDQPPSDNPDLPPDHPGNTPDENDPCAGVQCTNGTCSEGVCVTNEMKKIQDGVDCDPESFVEFCDGNRAVYCDRGIVVSGTCDEGCAIYEETYFGAVKMQAGCIDGGECSDLNELKRSCSMMKEGFGQVLAVACQKTSRNTQRWISVDGYYCKGVCDGSMEKCALQEDECDPYDLSNYSCDRHTLHTCYLDSNLTGNKRTEYCTDKCIAVNGISMCGYACSSEGEHSRVCMNADSMSIKDSADYYCRKTDSGELYSTWSGTYEVCDSGCNSSSGTCQ